MVWALYLPHLANAQGGFDGPGRYEIVNLDSGKVLDLDRNDRTSVIQFSSRGPTIRYRKSGHRATRAFTILRNAMNGNVLEADGTRNSMPVRPRVSMAAPTAVAL